MTVPPPRLPLPRIRIRPSELEAVRATVRSLRLNTVCEEALCPNRPECYRDHHVTVLILGDRCTRACRFCNVQGGLPGPVDPDEPRRVAEAVARLGMRHVVVTSVTRDDLPDGGAAQYAAVAEALAALPDPPTAEALVPDFRGDTAAVERVASAPYHVLGHNVETVPRLYPGIRPGADYRRSLGVLAAFRRFRPGAVVKSALMLGLGERDEEVRGVLEDLLRAGVDAVALGQYLRPGPGRAPVVRYVPEEEFERWAREARSLGFRHVVSGIRVRSSYRAAEALSGCGHPRPEPLSEELEACEARD